MCVLVTIATLTLIFSGRDPSTGTLLFDYDVLRDRVRDAVPDDVRKERALVAPPAVRILG